MFTESAATNRPLLTPAHLARLGRIWPRLYGRQVQALLWLATGSLESTETFLLVPWADLGPELQKDIAAEFYALWVLTNTALP